MENIDDILVDYVEAIFNLQKIIREKAKGDWSKLEILLENDEALKKSFDTIWDTLKIRKDEFREATSLGKFYTYHRELDRFFEIMEERTAALGHDGSVAFHLEEARDMIEDLLTDGSEDRRVKAIDMIAQLPNYSPDDWIRRKYMMKGFYLPGHETEVPVYLRQGIEEACCSFIYGNFRACIALARAVVEDALKKRFPLLADSKLNEIVNNMWFKIKGLKERDDVRRRVERIRIYANQVLHQGESNVERLCNELAAKTILGDLKEITEFLYTF
jgi:hypothetical protein